MKYRKLVVIIGSFAVMALGVNPSSAAPATIEQESSASLITTVKPIDSTPKVSAITASEVMHWVCRVITTMVGVSAYLYTVVITQGVMTLLAREVITYLAVPAIVCDWFF